MIDLSIIIVSYNTKKLTLDSLQSVFEQTGGITFEVIVLDNDSSDASAEAIAAKFPQVKLIMNKENIGFAQGNNIAIKEAMGEYVLLLNPDTVVLDEAIQKLLLFAKKNPDARIWGGRTLFGDGGLNPASCWKKITLWSVFCSAVGLTWVFPRASLFNPEGYGGWGRDFVRHVDIVSGCFFLIKRQTWEKLDGFSLEFFMYGEEADLCLRARKLGANPIITPDAEIIHYGGASEKVRADKMVRLFTAKVQLIRNHWNPMLRELGVSLFTLIPLTRILIFFILKVSGKKSIESSYETWRYIWQQRDKWKYGKWVK